MKYRSLYDFPTLMHKDTIKCIDIGDYIGNYKCHINSLSYCIKHKTSKIKPIAIVGCAQVFNTDEIVAHFIVKLSDGTYIDPTYGRMASMLYSYNIPIEEYNISRFKPNRELRLLKQYLYSLLPWYKKLFTNKERM